jgi:hypothetical protein
LTLSSPHIRSGPAIALSAILLLAVAVHGPLLLMQMPLGSYDANTHIFFASHYANHWFDPWNEKWYAGFSQTSYPPLTHQLIALFSHVLGLNLAYMLVQLIGILLLVTGVYGYARLWVDERSASFAAIGSVFLGSLAMLVYQSGQLPTTFAAALTLNAIPFFYRWLRDASLSALLKGLMITMAAAAAHHVTLLFGAVLFFLPVVWLSLVDRNREEADASVPGIISRAAMFAVFAGTAIAVVLLPYWIALVKNPIDQMPIPHGSRDNYLLNPISGLNFWVIPMGALILALPWIFLRGASQARLRPLFVGWYVTALIGLGGTSPVAKFMLDTVAGFLTLGKMRAFNVLTYERFTFWATLMALPLIGLLASRLIERSPRRAPAALWIAAVFTFSFAVAWTAFRPINSSPFKVDEVIAFLNRDGHDKFRYITLGFGNNFSKVAAQTSASSVDGDYNSARLLPELTKYGAGQLYNAKYFGASGMESLRAILKHANQYGLKYVFVRDRYYEPLLAFAGWRQTETYDNGNVTLWTRDDVQPAKKIESAMLPRPWEGLEWGTLPIASALLALFLVIAIPERKRRAEMVEFPAATDEEIAYREAR